MKIALVVPHIFMQAKLLDQVIFSPGFLALTLTDQLQDLGHKVTLFSPGPVQTPAKNITADLSLFLKELALRHDTYLDLLKKHPLVFINLSRQVQSELIAQAYEMANKGNFDLVHVWCNEEEIAMTFARFCQKPVVFTHHEPFNFLVKYRSIFPKYRNLNWVALSRAQETTFSSQQVNFVGTVYHGFPLDEYQFNKQTKDYFLYFGRIIEPKGVHLAIKACLEAKQKLLIAGKHYSEEKKNDYWQNKVAPLIDGKQIKYLGFVSQKAHKQKLLSQAQALLMPSIWEEPFGLVMVEALACGTPIIGFNNGAIPEIIDHQINGILVPYQKNQEKRNIKNFQKALGKVNKIKRYHCRQDFEKRFTATHMARAYLAIYQDLIK